MWYRCTAKACAKKPWAMTDAQEYLEAWCKQNEEAGIIGPEKKQPLCRVVTVQTGVQQVGFQNFV